MKKIIQQALAACLLLVCLSIWIAADWSTNTSPTSTAVYADFGSRAPNCVGHGICRASEQMSSLNTTEVMQSGLHISIQQAILY